MDDELLAELEALAEEYGKDCPNSDCICKKGNDG